MRHLMKISSFVLAILIFLGSNFVKDTFNPDPIEVQARDIFLGQYTAQDNMGETWDLDITAEPKATDEVMLINLGEHGEKVCARVIANELIIDKYCVGENTYSGLGSLEEGGTFLVINFSVSNGDGDLDCYARCTKN